MCCCRCFEQPQYRGLELSLTKGTGVSSAACLQSLQHMSSAATRGSGVTRTKTRAQTLPCCARTQMYALCSVNLQRRCRKIPCKVAIRRASSLNGGEDRNHGLSHAQSTEVSSRFRVQSLDTCLIHRKQHSRLHTLPVNLHATTC